MKSVILIGILATVLIAGCTSTGSQEPITEISIPGHPQIYVFSNDIRQSILVKAENERQIHDLFDKERHMNIVFNGTDLTDNGMFRIALIDLTAKIPFYFASQGKTTTIDMYYFVEQDGSQWYNAQNEMIDEPNLTGLTLSLKGPATGATETSVTLKDKTIILQGTSHKNMSLAADKLTLIVFGINDISKIKTS